MFGISCFHTYLPPCFTITYSILVFSIQIPSNVQITDSNPVRLIQIYFKYSQHKSFDKMCFIGLLMFGLVGTSRDWLEPVALPGFLPGVRAETRQKATTRLSGWVCGEVCNVLNLNNLGKLVIFKN